MDLDKVICDCLNVTNGMIKDAVDHGASTMEEIMDTTGAVTICEACADDVQRSLDYFATERDA